MESARERDRICGTQRRFTGTFAPFARDAATRSSDPRRAILERYATRDAYERAYAATARTLASDGYLLAEDLGAVDALAARRWHDVVETGSPEREP